MCVVSVCPLQCPGPDTLLVQTPSSTSALGRPPSQYPSHYLSLKLQEVITALIQSSTYVFHFHHLPHFLSEVSGHFFTKSFISLQFSLITQSYHNLVTAPPKTAPDQTAQQISPLTQDNYASYWVKSVNGSSGGCVDGFGVQSNNAPLCSRVVWSQRTAVHSAVFSDCDLGLWPEPLS